MGEIIDRAVEQLKVRQHGRAVLTASRNGSLDFSHGPLELSARLRQEEVDKQ